MKIYTKQKFDVENFDVFNFRLFKTHIQCFFLISSWFFFECILFEEKGQFIRTTFFNCFHLLIMYCTLSIVLTIKKHYIPYSLCFIYYLNLQFFLFEFFFEIQHYWKCLFTMKNLNWKYVILNFVVNACVHWLKRICFECVDKKR